LLYFIYPQTLCKSKTINCEFDQTIRTWSDTIDIGVTIGTKEVFKVDSLKIECKSGKMYLKADHLYTEKRKNRWGCRFFVHVPIAEIAKFFSDMPPFVCFYGNGKDISFGIKQKLWRKIFENNKNLYFQIELNK